MAKDDDKSKKDAAAAKAKAKGAAGKKAKAADAGPAPTYKRDQPPRLKRVYDSQVRETMMKDFGYASTMQVPRVVKITVNMGLGRANQDSKIIDSAVEEVKAITGQAPVVCKAKKDVATFKLRKGQKIGVMVTLRRERMWEFLDRLCNVALPRVRDFRGVSPKGFDGRGNFTLGVREQIIFPEIEYDQIDSIKGLNISIVTTAKTDAEGRALLAQLGMPFRQTAPAQGAAA
ncbi:MAG: 50S ribosomal protein L5 [Kofleriaceae bacterium]|nr:50S ribosomal protein L5 [Myxococcales bacterium]MCB9564306.1 50S ribosomal protein L5 [Kofleriaceae bacterium]MCB9570959.1 50S ribosomal protein L5 [Kofleriaceae bacterium]